MSANTPEFLDVWQMVAASGRVDGQAPLARLLRLRDLLADSEGHCHYVLEFGRDPAASLAWVKLQVRTDLPLVCQRSLQRFLLPVVHQQHLVLVRNEAEEMALSAHHDALLVPEDGRLRVLDLVEDELILAVPVVPVAPESQPVVLQPDPATVRTGNSPFALLASLKKA